MEAHQFFASLKDNQGHDDLTKCKKLDIWSNLISILLRQKCMVEVESTCALYVEARFTPPRLCEIYNSRAILKGKEWRQNGWRLLHGELSDL